MTGNNDFALPHGLMGSPTSALCLCSLSYAELGEHGKDTVGVGMCFSFHRSVLSPLNNSSCVKSDWEYGRRHIITSIFCGISDGRVKRSVKLEKSLYED